MTPGTEAKIEAQPRGAVRSDIHPTMQTPAQHPVQLRNPAVKRKLQFAEDPDRTVVARRLGTKFPSNEGCLTLLEEETSSINAFLAGERDFTPAYHRLAAASRYYQAVLSSLRGATVMARLRENTLEGKVEVLERRLEVMQKRVELATAELKMWRRL